MCSLKKNTKFQIKFIVYLAFDDIKMNMSEVEEKHRNVLCLKRDYKENPLLFVKQE